MSEIKRTSELMTDGILREVSQPKFKLGEEVNIVGERGYYGKVVLSEPYQKRYLLDCSPGAVGGYTWVWMKTDYGEDLLALNWFDEKQLRKIK